MKQSDCVEVIYIFVEKEKILQYLILCIPTFNSRKRFRKSIIFEYIFIKFSIKLELVQIEIICTLYVSIYYVCV